MEEKRIENVEELETGAVKISNEVVGVIASLAIGEINGILGISTGLVEGFTNMFSKKNLHKGVKITFEENKVIIDLNITVEYGVKIHEVCHEAQKAVKVQVESMTGIDIQAVNIYVHDVAMQKKAEPVSEEAADQE